MSECLYNAILVRRLWRCLERPLLPGNFYLFVEHIYNIFCPRTRRKDLGPGSSPEEHLPSFLAVATTNTGQEEDNQSKGVMFGELVFRSLLL